MLDFHFSALSDLKWAKKWSRSGLMKFSWERLVNGISRAGKWATTQFDWMKKKLKNCDVTVTRWPPEVKRGSARHRFFEESESPSQCRRFEPLFVQIRVVTYGTFPPPSPPVGGKGGQIFFRPIAYFFLHGGGLENWENHEPITIWSIGPKFGSYIPDYEDGIEKYWTVRLQWPEEGTNVIE